MEGAVNDARGYDTYRATVQRLPDYVDVAGFVAPQRAPTEVAPDRQLGPRCRHEFFLVAQSAVGGDRECHAIISLYRTGAVAGYRFGNAGCPVPKC